MAKRSKSEAALNRAAAMKAEADTKLAAAKSALEAHGREIAARIVIADKALAELKDKAGAPLKAFVNHRIAVAKMLADAHAKCKAAKVPFEEFQRKYAPNYQRALTYELIAIGQGKLTIEDRTAAATKRKQKSRAAAKIAATVTYKSDDGRTVVTKCKTLAEAKTLAANCEGADAVIEATTVEKCRITKALHKAEASGDAAALAAALAERETADMIFRETMTIGSDTFPVFKLNYENDFSDGFENGCLTREEIAANARYKEAAEGDTLTKPVVEIDQAKPVDTQGSEPPAENPEEISSRVLSAEEISDDALTEFKAACVKLCPVMSDADLKLACLYVQGKDGNGQGTWRPRNAAIKKAA